MICAKAVSIDVLIPEKNVVGLMLGADKERLSLKSSS